MLWGGGSPNLLTGISFQLGRDQAGHSLPQGLLFPLGMEELQLSLLLLPKGQAIALLWDTSLELASMGPAEQRDL